MDKEIYRHYGNKQFVRPYFTPVTNRYWGNKPHGGLYACPTKDVDIGWDEWSKGNDFMTDRLEKHFDFTLKDGAKVLVIKDLKDLDKLPRIDMGDKNLIDTYCITDMNADIDFEKLSKEYDAMMVWMYRSTDIPEEDSFMNGIYYKLYGWDVDTLLVFNPNIIDVIKED